MAEPTILEKLRCELAQEITTERQVVYVLAEIRKLLELRDEKDTFFALNFHCCWALHTRMDKTGARRILEKFDEAHAAAIAAGGTRPENVPAGLWSEVLDTMMYVKFAGELEKYLALHNLPAALVQSMARWTQFLSLYTDIIEECPLQLAAQRIGLPHIKAVTVFKIREGFPPAASTREEVMFGAEWQLTCLNPAESGSWTMFYEV